MLTKLVVLAVLAVNNMEALPQFSVFNRQLFPNFNFGGGAPRPRPVARPPQPPRFNPFQPRPQPQFFSRPPTFVRPEPVPAPRPQATPTFFTSGPTSNPVEPHVDAVADSEAIMAAEVAAHAANTGSAPAPPSHVPVAIATPPPPPPSSGSCRPDKTNYEYNGQYYWVQWKDSSHPTKYTYDGAKASCDRVNMKIISMDDPNKREHFLQLLERDHYEYFWAGGKIFGGSLQWENGRREHIARGRYPWSHAGFEGPQPEGNGQCLAILNNVYQDRVKFHDVACHHTKPTICECPN